MIFCYFCFFGRLWQAINRNLIGIFKNGNWILTQHHKLPYVYKLAIFQKVIFKVIKEWVDFLRNWVLRTQSQNRSMDHKSKSGNAGKSVKCMYLFWQVLGFVLSQNVIVLVACFQRRSPSCFIGDSHNTAYIHAHACM